MSDTVNVLNTLGSNIYSLSNLKCDAGDDVELCKAVDNLAALFLERAAKKLKGVGMTNGFPDEVAQMVKDGQGKIPCIKRLRELTNSSLTDAKNAVEKWAADNGYIPTSNGGTAYYYKTW